MKILEEEGKIVFYPTGHINADNAAVFEKEATEGSALHFCGGPGADRCRRSQRSLSPG